MIEIRPLKTHDFFTVARILSKIGNKVSRQLTKETSESQAGLLLLTTALEYAEGDTMDWLANLCGKSKDEFSQMDFDTPILVIEQLIEKEDIKTFLARARALATKYSTKQ